MKIAGYLSIKFYLLLFFLFSCPFLIQNVKAQDNTPEEVYLSFNHRGIINTVIITYYKDGIFYLPIYDLFENFQIDVEVNDLTVFGKFSVDQIPYSIDFSRQVLTFGEKTIHFSADDFILDDLDFYLPISIYQEAFDLSFSVDFNTLSLNLETDQELPIIAKVLRQQRRKIANANKSFNEMYPLLLDRQRNIFKAGFFDYSLTSLVSQDQQNFNMSSSIGFEILGGDLRGTGFGNFNSNSTVFETDNLRWNYVFSNNSLVTQVTIGQSNLNGVLTYPFTGMRITNEPIEPRRFFDEFEIEGSTIPQSEVELYLNNALVDFQQADELGNYRFLTPIFFGTSQLDLRIFGPNGQIIQRSNRIQVPFTFTPKGEFVYDINIGRLDDNVIRAAETSNVAIFSGSWGLTNWATGKFGVEYYNTIDPDPFYTGTLSSRIANNYVITFEGVTRNYLRSTLSAIYPNSSSISLDYIDYTNDSQVYNTSGLQRQFIVNTFYPFSLFGIPLNIRASNYLRYRENSYNSSFRLNLVSRIKKVSLRFGYSDQFVNEFTPFQLTSTANLEASATYTVSRNPNVPKIFRGTFVRASADYLPNLKTLSNAEVLFSRNILNKGRLQLVFGRDIRNKFNTLRLNVIFDFNKVRTNTTVTYLRNSFSTNQNVRGSIGYDANYNNLIFTSRDQVGRSGAAIRLFVDNNDNQAFDEADELIPNGDVRIGRTGSISTLKNGVLYYTQMQPYLQYNLEINKASISNPMLVPEVDKFSIITDPNNFKLIEIPFYQSGVMEGIVLRRYPDGNQKGIGGLKIILSSESRDFNKELRTFSDGSFYEYPLPPGKYNLRIEQNQLDILSAKSDPETIHFEIQKKTDGDFVEGLLFTLLPKDEETEEAQQQKLTISQVTDEIKSSPEILEFSEEIYSKIDEALRFIVKAQNAFYSRDLEHAFLFVNQSLELFETAQGYALKGSFYYFEGNREEAQRNWQMALKFNPDLYIPDMETLEERVKTSSSDE